MEVCPGAPTCDVCGGNPDCVLTQPDKSDDIHMLCAYHLARFAIDNLAGRDE